ncbi:hypothetical protein [Maricaulis alexandrii]|jgi:hypothetical protein|nr:hypothetical protein [Maricaulis alexandrii]
MRQRAKAIAIAKRIDEDRAERARLLMTAGLITISIIIGAALLGALPTPV